VVAGTGELWLSRPGARCRDCSRSVSQADSPTHDDRSDEFWSREPSTQQGPRQSEVLTVRKVVAYELLSLDGVAEKPDGFIADWDDAMAANLGAVIAAQDSVILGRRTYEEWAEFWPGSDSDPFAIYPTGAGTAGRYWCAHRSARSAGAAFARVG
jgi:hypothetical protein